MSAMVLTPRSLTVNTALSDNLKRKLQVYVEIPPSPLHTSSGSSSFAKINAFNPRKSGTPLTNKALNIDVSRKQDTLESPMKKQKLNPSGISSIALEKTSQATVATERNAKWLEKFPEGFFICHHCRQHKGLKDNHLTCTARKGPKYYPIVVIGDAFVARASALAGLARKAKLRELRKPNLYTPSRLRPVVELPMSPLPKFGPSAPTTKIGKPKRKPVVPQPKWVEVDTDLSQNDAEDRFFIREFLLRFSPIMDISQTNLETLDDFEHFSDGAVKSYTMQLLSLIAADAPTGAQNACQFVVLAIKATIKKISSVGLNPGAIWTQLSLLRGTVSSSVLTFPDPDAISSRTSRNRTANAITSSKQLLPIIVARNW
ncbi:hypothetical protein SCHPADRAFT_935297 [Schizopora paradoxa]|uniref:Uncharacterized protein n=1 Tax=Schizopora paradoxa TaxID=27342 RepID=A0A0H2SR15_9AGAM|nr:hypothetical protein SCHPADRAFT_935297 [Schizopora paradoxa]